MCGSDVIISHSVYNMYLLGWHDNDVWVWIKGKLDENDIVDSG